MDKKAWTKLVTENLPKIKKLFKDEVEPEVQEENFVDVKSEDGTLLRVEPALEVGATVQVIGEDAELINAPDGDIALEDGSAITIEGGIITEVIVVEAEEETEMEAEVEEVETEEAKLLDTEVMTEKILKKVDEIINAKIDNLKFKEELEAVKVELKEYKEANIKLLEMVEKFADTPSEEPKKLGRNPFKKKDTFDWQKAMTLKK